MFKKKTRFKKGSGYSFSEAKKVEDKASSLNRRLIDFADWIDNLHLVRIFASLSSFLLLIALFTFVNDLDDKQISQINSAWQLLHNDKPGSSGEREALEYLNSQKCFGLCWKERVDLTYVDLASKENKAYLKDINLKNANLYQAKLNSAILVSANFQNASLISSEFDDAELVLANFDNTVLYDSSFVNSKSAVATFLNARIYETSFNGAILPYSDFRGATILEDTDFSNANLSRADFTKVTFLRVVDEKAFKKLMFQLIMSSDLSESDLEQNLFEPLPVAQVCKMLSKAENWEESYRDSKYSCNKAIPDYSNKDSMSDIEKVLDSLGLMIDLNADPSAPVY
ncbi:pentapeptide repeat-containing protein [Vibrio sp. T187]|uniref:pentapeptide repeat-containing protein n=1 Tax=Vibrio TaxID=662 RepID=UPI0010C98F79|nr:MULTISPECIES: pentapeptide repeat-containing protein [Vibrio]MBW3695727.1 pentapeptide repeat-containing protein [Vibrio sp. T187]